MLKPGEPCGHPGCLSHVPCEGCGRIRGDYLYIVSSGNGYFTRFNGDSPLMDTDPLCATRMRKWQAEEVIEQLEALGFVGELVLLVFAPIKQEEIEAMLETDVVLAIEMGETEEGVLSRYGLSIDRLDEIMEAHDRGRCAICGSWWLAFEILDGYCPECQEEML